MDSEDPGHFESSKREGDEVGNHTYYHPNLALCWPEHIRLELNATQLLLETITGRATTLFRPPYAADTRREHYFAARRGRRSLANSRSPAADSRLVAHAGRQRGAFEQAAWNDP